MRRANLFTTAALLGLTGLYASALAQTTSGLDPATGARPGHVPGVGVSLPLSNNASNFGPSGTQSDIAPTLPQPSVGEHAGTQDYLRAARSALTAGHTGEAQQSLEMAQTRALDRSVPQGDTSRPSDSQLVARIQDALRALGGGDNAHAIQLIDLALAG